MNHLGPAAYLVAVSVVLCITGLVATRVSSRLAQHMQLASTRVVSRTENNRNSPATVLGSRDTLYLFYYLDRQLAKSLYEQLPWNGRILANLTIEHEAVKEASLGMNHVLASLRSRFKRMSRVRATYKEERNAQRMYRAVQDYLRDILRMTTLDLVDGFDMAPIAGLISNYIQLERDHGFSLLPDETDSLEARWREHQDKEGAQHLLKLEGIVAIRALYRVEKSPAEGVISLIASSGSVHGVSVLARCAGKSNGENGCAQMIPGTTIEVTCVGRVHDRDPVRRELVILPIAIFAFL